MAFIEYNPNPVGRRVGDCSVRAVARALNMGWEAAFIALTMNGLSMGDMPSSDSVWGATLRQNGFYRDVIPDTCPACYTVEDFCIDHPEGIFVLGLGGHAVAVEDGDIYDSWDSSKEIPQFYWYKKEDKDGI